jgi:arylsulfatase A-like enzyme
MNILIITMVPLRVDHLSCYGYFRNTTPNIDSLAKEGSMFESAYSTGAWTPPSHASLLTGLYPSWHGVQGAGKLFESIPTIASIFGNNEYSTVGFVNVASIGSATGLDRGFDQFNEEWRVVLTKKGGGESAIKSHFLATMQRILRISRLYFGFDFKPSDAKRTTIHAINWLGKRRNRNKPFFMMIDYHGLNMPYKLRYRYISRSNENINWKMVNGLNFNPYWYQAGSFGATSADLSALKGLYDAEIYHLDRSLGKLFSYMSDAGILDNTLIVLTSTHGNNFGEHGLMGHHGCLFETLIHVPLIMRLPNVVPAGKQIKNLVQTIDILPTVCELTNIRMHTKVQGKSLLPTFSNKNIRDCAIAEWEGKISHGFEKTIQNTSDATLRNSIEKRYSIPMKMIRKGQYKLIKGEDGTDLLYDLSKDPDESLNISAKAPEMVHHLTNQLHCYFSSLSHSVQIPRDQVQDRIVREELKLGGYKI